MTQKEGSNIWYATNSELADANLRFCKDTAQAGDFLLGADGERKLLIKVEQRNISHAGLKNIKSELYRHSKA